MACELFDRHERQPLGARLLNVNVPDVPHAALRGYRITRLGRRHKAENVVATRNPRGETVYWVGAAGAAADAGEGTDFHAVEQGYASVTPLQIDLTNDDEMPGVAKWLAVVARRYSGHVGAPGGGRTRSQTSRSGRGLTRRGMVSRDMGAGAAPPRTVGGRWERTANGCRASA